MRASGRKRTSSAFANLHNEYIGQLDPYWLVLATNAPLSLPPSNVYRAANCVTLLPRWCEYMDSILHAYTI